MEFGLNPKNSSEITFPSSIKRLFFHSAGLMLISSLKYTFVLIGNLPYLVFDGVATVGYSKNRPDASGVGFLSPLEICLVASRASPKGFLFFSY